MQRHCQWYLQTAGKRVSTRDEEKAARLAAALRENLKRRKGRERALDAAPPPADDVKR